MSNTQLDAIRKMLTENPVIPAGATLEQMRAGFDATGSSKPTIDGVSNEAVAAGGVAAEWIVPDGAPRKRVVLYFHGGGYAIGSIDSHRYMLDRLARATGDRVLALNYRLAPEHPFPAAVDDAVAAFNWLVDQGNEPAQITIAGDSAGGGLAIAALVALRDQGGAMPGCAVAISPWADMEASGGSMETKAAVDPMVQKPIIDELAQTYLQGQDLRSPLASPLYADLSNLPPVLIHVGEAETLLDDSIRIEAALKAAGCAVTLEVWEEMIHVWHLFAPLLDKGQEAIDRVASYIEQQLG
ncbi:MAG: alpha/beta hydrolase [Pseudomonadota bacterium]